jgi:hypothetical protein
MTASPFSFKSVIIRDPQAPLMPPQLQLEVWLVAGTNADSADLTLQFDPSQGSLVTIVPDYNWSVVASEPQNGLLKVSLADGSLQGAYPIGTTDNQLLGRFVFNLVGSGLNFQTTLINTAFDVTDLRTSAGGIIPATMPAPFMIPLPDVPAVSAVYQSIMQVGLAADEALAVAIQIANGTLTLSQYETQLLGSTSAMSSVLPALMMIDIFYGATPSASVLAAVSTTVQNWGNLGMTPTDQWSVLGLQFAHNGTFGTLYGNLDNYSFAGKIYQAVFGYAPTPAIQSALSDNVTALSLAYKGYDPVHSDMLGGKGALYAALLYYAENAKIGYFYTGANNFLLTQAHIAEVSGVTPTYTQGDELTVQFPSGVSAANASGTQSNTLVKGFAVSDSSANVANALDALNADSKLLSISLTDFVPLTISYSQYVNDTVALGKITGSYALFVSGAPVSASTKLQADPNISGFSISDAAANVQAALDSVGSASKLTAISFTDIGEPVFSVTLDQFINDHGAISKIITPYSSSVGDQPIPTASGQVVLTVEQQIEILYTVYIGRLADPTGEQYWSSILSTGTPLASISSYFALTANAMAGYTLLYDEASGVEATYIDAVEYLTKLYGNLFNRPIDDEALAVWVPTILTASISGGAILAGIIQGTFASSDPQSLTDQLVLANKTTVASRITDAIANAGLIPSVSGTILYSPTLLAILNGVTATNLINSETAAAVAMDPMFTLDASVATISLEQTYSAAATKVASDHTAAATANTKAAAAIASAAADSSRTLALANQAVADAQAAVSAAAAAAQAVASEPTDAGTALKAAQAVNNAALNVFRLTTAAVSQANTQVTAAIAAVSVANADLDTANTNQATAAKLLSAAQTALTALSLTNKTVAQALAIYAQNPNMTPVTVADTSSNVSASIDQLQQMIAAVSSVALADADPLSLTYTQYLNDSALLGKIGGSYTLSVSGAPQSAVTALQADSHVASFSITNTAANILQSLDSLNTANKINSIAFSDGGTPLLPMTYNQYTSDSTALSKFIGPYALAVSLVPLSAIAILQADSSVASFSISGQGLAVLGSLRAISGDSKISSISLTDYGTSLQLEPTGPFTEGIISYNEIIQTSPPLLSGVDIGATLSITSYSTVSLSGTLALAGALTLSQSTINLNGGSIYAADIKGSGAQNGTIHGYGTIHSSVTGDMANSSFTSFDASGGTLDVLGPVTNSGGVNFTIGAGSTLEFGSASDASPNFTSSSGTLKLDRPDLFSGFIWGFQVGDTLDLGGVTVGSVNYDGSDLNVGLNNGTSIWIGMAGYIGPDDAIWATPDGSGGTNLAWVGPGIIVHGDNNASASAGLNAPSLMFIGIPDNLTLGLSPFTLQFTLQASSGIEEIGNFQYGLDALNIDLKGSANSVLQATDTTVNGVHAISIYSSADPTHGVVLLGMTSGQTAANLLSAHTTFSNGKAIIT